MDQAARSGSWPPGAGAMAGLTRALDWAATPLGPPGAWPDRLRGAVELMLDSPLVSTLAVGPGRVLLYNDAAARLYGDRHPGALGRPLPETWPEAYATVAPLYDRAFAGEAVEVPAQPLDVSRAGGEVFDVTLTPLRGEGGEVAAVHMIGFEVGARLGAEASLRASEARFRQLFERMDQGFCVIERVDGPPDAPGDYRYLTANPAFARHTGLRDPVGRTIRELVPEPEASTMAIYDEVARTGEPRRFEAHVAALDLWIEVEAVPADGPGRLAVLFSDVSARKRAEATLRASEERQAFLLRLSDALRPLGDPDAIQHEACRLLAERLGAGRAFYMEVDEAAGLARVARDVTRDGAPSLAGTHRLADFGWSISILRRGESYAIADTQTSAHVPDAERPASAALQIVAVLAAPLIKNGRLVGALGVTLGRPREWSAAEVELAREVGERIWAAAEQARAEAALGASEALFRRFADASPDVLWIRDAGTLRFDYVSPAFETIYGDAFERVFARNDVRRWARLILPEDRAGALDAFRRVREGERVTHEFRVRRPTDGALRWIRDNSFPLLGEGGRVQRVAGIGQDVTELKRVQAAVAASEARLRVLTEGIPQLVWRAADHGKWTWASPQWTAFTGQAEEDSHGWGWLDALHPDDRKGAREAWDRSRATGEFHAEYRLREAATGAFRWFQTRATPVRDDEGSLVEWLGTTTDVQGLREMQDRLRVLVAELQHRTRNLMGVVLGVMRRTRRGSPDLERFAADFESRMGAMARVQGLLSRLHEGNRVAFDELIRAELVAIGALDGDGWGAQVTLDGPQGVRLRSSTVQTFALALHELATNAAKYGALSQRGGRLAVRWRRLRGTARGDPGAVPGPQLCVEWTESGVAMPEPGAAPQGGGYGRELIERALPYQLGAQTSFEMGADGVRCTITLPLSSSAEK